MRFSRYVRLDMPQRAFRFAAFPLARSGLEPERNGWQLSRVPVSSCKLEPARGGDGAGGSSYKLEPAVGQTGTRSGAEGNQWFQLQTGTCIGVNSSFPCGAGAPRSRGVCARLHVFPRWETFTSTGTFTSTFTSAVRSRARSRVRARSPSLSRVPVCNRNEMFNKTPG